MPAIASAPFDGTYFAPTGATADLEAISALPFVEAKIALGLAIFHSLLTGFIVRLYWNDLAIASRNYIHSGGMDIPLRDDCGRASGKHGYGHAKPAIRRLSSMKWGLQNAEDHAQIAQFPPYGR